MANYSDAHKITQAWPRNDDRVWAWLTAVIDRDTANYGWLMWHTRTNKVDWIERHKFRQTDIDTDLAIYCRSKFGQMVGCMMASTFDRIARIFASLRCLHWSPGMTNVSLSCTVDQLSAICYHCMHGVAVFPCRMCMANADDVLLWSTHRGKGSFIYRL